MQACQNNGMQIFPWTMEMLPDLQAMDPESKHSLDEYRERFGDDYVMSALQRYGVIPGGTALTAM